MSRSKAMLYIFICALFWSSGGVLIKLIDANAFVISGLRSLLALPLLVIYYKPAALRFNKKVWLSALTITATGILFVLATKLTTAANAIILMYCSPVFIVLINRIFYKERIIRANIFVSVACIAGMVLFFFDKISPGNMLGNFLAIMSGITNAAFVVIMNRSTEHLGSINVAAQIETIAISLPFFFLYPFVPTTQSILALIALGTLQRGVSIVIYSRASRHCSSMDAVLISTAEPLCNPLLVMLFFNEIPGKFALLGGSVVVISVLVWNMYMIKTHAPAED